MQSHRRRITINDYLENNNYRLNVSEIVYDLDGTQNLVAYLKQNPQITQLNVADCQLSALFLAWHKLDNYQTWV